MYLLSTISLDAVLLYGTAGPLRSLRNDWAPPLHFFTQVGLSFVRDEFSAWWQVALVVSVLEEDKLQFFAFFTSAKLRKGNRFTGFVLMFLYFGWRSLPNLLGLKRWSFTSGVAYAFVDRGLFCLGEVMNWVACTIYYHDCRIATEGRRLLPKKINPTLENLTSVADLQFSMDVYFLCNAFLSCCTLGIFSYCNLEK
ncbi:hypothetical protein ACLB2K_043202 [Fragaria x ananassa]